MSEDSTYPTGGCKNRWHYHDDPSLRCPECDTSKAEPPSLPTKASALKNLADAATKIRNRRKSPPSRYPKVEFFVRSLRERCEAPGKAHPPETCGCLLCWTAKFLRHLAAQAQPEPVAWRWRRMIKSGWSKWFLETERKMAYAAVEIWGDDEVEVEPLIPIQKDKE